MSEELKSLIKQYNQAYEMSKQLPILKARIIPAIKNQGLQDIKFKFGDHSIGYHNYNDTEGLTQKLIKQTLTKHYPNINASDFMNKLLGMRKIKAVETLKIRPF